MSMNTYLQGRLRNTPLPQGNGLFCLFEAVVNSIHAIDERGGDPSTGEILVEILRVPQISLALDQGKAKRGVPPQEDIVGFKVTDNGIGFNDANYTSFETLDSDYKASQGCRGVGRLLWLKAFQRISVDSTFLNSTGKLMHRDFTFNATQGVVGKEVVEANPSSEVKTSVFLDGYSKLYREKSPKTAKTIANSLLEHCLWYFVRQGGAPKVWIKDEDESISLDEVYEQYMHSSASRQQLNINGCNFELTHIKLKAGSAKPHFIAWCAGGRLVEEENLAGKVPGLYGKIREEDGDFTYACYVTSDFLDVHVRPERIGFDIKELTSEMFSGAELSLQNIRDQVIQSIRGHLGDYLELNQKAGRERLEEYTSRKAPRYRPILGRISKDKLDIDPSISDKELDLFLHKQLSEIEGVILTEGHELMNFGTSESPEQYRARLASYLEMVDDIKKSDLASYVSHRKVLLDILEKAISKGVDGKYSREHLIHELIMPLRKTSTEVRLDSCNLWLIDERLAFHDFLASDKPISTMPITTSQENKEPDIVALNVFDEPILVADTQSMPLASIVVVEIKRPMRNDAASGEDKDPVEQALGYLDRIRQGGAQTPAGRPIPKCQDIPGFVYVVCDITPTIARRCKLLNLNVTHDHLGYFGYNSNFKAYIEVNSFDRLLNSSRERNRAFFDKLGLPTT